MFVPEIAFDLLVKRQIVRLEEPALQCCELIFDELLSVANQCDAPEFSRFTIVREKIIEQVYVCIRNRLGPARDMISNLIAIELAYVNTSHPDFVGGSNTISALKDSQVLLRRNLLIIVRKKTNMILSNLSLSSMNLLKV